MYYKREINFNDYKSCLNPSKTEKKINILNVNNQHVDKMIKKYSKFSKEN